MDNIILIEGNKFTLQENGIYSGAYLGKMNIWGRETDVIFENVDKSEEAIEKFIEKVSWLNDNKLDVIDAFMEENYECIEFASDEFDTEITEDDFRDAMFVNNIYIFINGRNSEFSFDLDAEPDYLCGHLANMIVSSNYEIECDGLNG